MMERLVTANETEAAAPSPARRVSGTKSQEQQGKITILFASGWTSGPIPMLKEYCLEHVSSSSQIQVLQAQRLPMPPLLHKLRDWCLADPTVIAGCIAMAVASFTSVIVYPISSKEFQTWPSWQCVMYITSMVIFFLVLLRYFTAYVAGRAVQRGIEICHNLLMKDHQEHDHIVLVGFSWGGVILCEYVLKHWLSPNSRSEVRNVKTSLLMMAPPTYRLSQAWNVLDAPFRFSKLLKTASKGDLPHMHVVHATRDPCFCPKAHRWQNVPHVEYTLLTDNHILCKPKSQDKLKEILKGMILMEDLE